MCRLSSTRTTSPEASETIWALVRALNKHVEESKPVGPGEGRCACGRARPCAVRPRRRYSASPLVALSAYLPRVGSARSCARSDRPTTSRGAMSRPAVTVPRLRAIAPAAPLFPRVDAPTRRRVIDTHAHLDALEDPAAAVARRATAGVTRIISIGTDPISWASTLAIVEEHDGVYGVVGLHPHEAASDVRRRRARAASRAIPRSSPWARSGSTTTATTRRAMRRRSCSSTSSGSRSRRSCPS